MAHAHPHVPHELTEGKEDGKPTSHGERVLELGAVLLLSMTAVATAWSGYQAARWSGEQSKGYAQASTARIHSQRQASHAGQVRIDDLLYFNGWLNAHSTGHQALAAIYERRFRAGFVPAFRAWIAQRPFTNPNAIPGPLYMPQFHLPALDRSHALDDEADGLYKEGTDAKTNDDHYILSTVFFAAVLFFAGISLRLDWRPLRITVLVFASLMLLSGLVFVLTLPIA
jgi:hypothetical protein